MASSQAELVQKLVDAGIHFGTATNRWNPKMQPYIHGKRGAFHIINVKETVKGLLRAKRFLAKSVAEGKDVLFVGTKRQARNAVEEHARRCGMHFVSERWLGGTLTNFRTIRSRLNRLEELEKLWDTGEIETYSKKMKATLGRELKKIKTNLDGIRAMDKMPGIMFIIDTKREGIAVKEAHKLHIPTVALIDTDGDPDLVDLPIPGNDDAMRGIELIMSELADAVLEGKGQRSPEKQAAGPQGPGARGARRSSRASFRADDGTPQVAPIATAGPGDVQESAGAELATQAGTDVTGATPGENDSEGSKAEAVSAGQNG